MGADLTGLQKLLAVAAGLPEPFTEADLIVAAWRAHPKSFGLRGREAEHPCSNAVRSYLVGRRGLVARQVFAKVAPLTYRLTPFGRREVGGPRRDLAVPRLTADAARTLDALLRHPAFVRFRAGRPEMVTGELARDFLRLAGESFVTGVLGLARGRAEVEGVGGPWPVAVVRQLEACRAWAGRLTARRAAGRGA